MTFGFSVVVISVYMAAFYLVAVLIFNKRDVDV
jgi:ABC-type transport system involved in multi-copper enzyme maturation permease subunit